MKVRQLLENKASQYLYEDYYNSYKNELVNIMKNLKRNNKKIVLWGFGKKGKAFLDTVNKDVNLVDVIVDINPKLTGKKYKKFEIKEYSMLSKGNDYIVFIVNGIFFSDNVMHLKKIDFKGEVYDLDDIIRNRVCAEEIINNIYFRKATDIDYDKLHSSLLIILKEIDRVCKKNNIKYFLEGGTALGAIRHGGFIPWDDDADIGMLRDDFEKFRQIAKRDLDERFFFQTARRKSDYYNLFDQVGIINSSYTTEDQLHLNMFHGIHVDIFAYDYFSENDQESKSRYLKLIKYVQKLHLKKRKSFVNKKNVLKRVIINYKYYFMKLVPFKVLINKINKIQISKDGNKNEIGCWFMERGVVKSFNYNDIFPIINKKFEDVELPVSNNYHKYLTKVYGDYMELPPEELRTVRNRIVDISFDRRLSNEIEKGEKLL